MDFNQIANRTDCMVGDLQTMIECLQNKTTDEIQSAIKELTFNPVYDGDFVVVLPTDIFTNETEKATEILKSFGKFDFVFGVTSDEGGFFIPSFDHILSPQGAATNPSAGYTLDTFETLAVPMLMAVVPRIRLTNTLQKTIAHEYIDWKDTSNQIRMRQGAINLMSDIGFNADMIHAANVHSGNRETGQTFFYVYDHRLSLLPPDRGFDGAAHSEELGVVFGLDKVLRNVESVFDTSRNMSSYDDPAELLPAHEIVFSRQVMEYWTNFAKTG